MKCINPFISYLSLIAPIYFAWIPLTEAVRRFLRVFSLTEPVCAEPSCLRDSRSRGLTSSGRSHHSLLSHAQSQWQGSLIYHDWHLWAFPPSCAITRVLRVLHNLWPFLFVYLFELHTETNSGNIIMFQLIMQVFKNCYELFCNYRNGSLDALDW